MENKVCVITGANSGIGKIVATELAKKGAKVIMVCRNKVRGIIALEDIKHNSKNSNVELMIADLSLQKDIRKLALNIKNKYPKIHVLVNNAAIISKDYHETVDGIEITFATNHFAYFLLTNLLLDNLKAVEGARIINVASGSERIGKIDFDDLFMRQRYSQFWAYANSKLANIIFTYELARRLEGTNVITNCIHPGSTKTNIGKGSRGVINLSFKLLRPFMWSAGKGAETIIWLASSPELNGVNGKYFFNKKETKSKRISYDREVANRLWKLSEDLTGLSKD